MNNWTPDRPTKPGKYWLSVHPDKREACEVAARTECWVDEGADFYRIRLHGHRELVIDRDAAILDRALWRPYVDPADPHAQPVPQPDGTALPPDELDDLETIITSGKGQAEVPRDVATSVGDYCAQCAYDCMELPVLVKDGHWQCQRRAHWYPVRVRVWLDAIRECRQERGDRAERETLAPQPVPSLRSRVEALPWKSYRMSDDPMTPNLRLILDADVGIVTLYEADMTSRSDTAQETERHDKIVMSPDDARWLRDQLVALLESEGM